MHGYGAWVPVQDTSSAIPKTWQGCTAKMGLGISAIGVDAQRHKNVLLVGHRRLKMKA
jgi:hypothetical protein